ncbi:MAG: hypothetical protein RBS09_06785 [Anaerolineaceae bacterium]|jgi:hypothetical protein|nr:hypothetical protein [Anaerolineaceae bacterium]
MPSCNNHFRKNDNDQRKDSQAEDYRRRFTKEMGRPVFTGHALHHIYPKETLGPAFKTLGIDVNAPKNLAELPVRFKYGKKAIIHQERLHGKDDEGRDTETAFINDFFIKHGLANNKNGSIDFTTLENLSTSEKKHYRELARDFAVDFVKSRTKGIDLGDGITCADCIGGAPYYD